MLQYIRNIELSCNLWCHFTQVCYIADGTCIVNIFQTISISVYDSSESTNQKLVHVDA